MAILKVDTITSADTPTVSITDGASISGVTTFSNGTNITSGNLLLGQNTAYDVYGSSKLQIATTDSTAAISISRWSDNGSSPYINIGKSRGAFGTPTVVQSGDRLGQINFTGADGTDLASPAAGIAAYVDGTPGSNDMPGRLVFFTASDGGVAETERVRIDKNGQLVLSNGSMSTAYGNSICGGTNLELDTTGIIKFRTDTNQKMSVTDNGLCFGTDSAAANALDDYEEGTHTINQVGTGGGVPLSNNVCNYTKIGNICHVHGLIDVGASSGTSAVEFSLPFTSKAQSGGAYPRTTFALMHKHCNIHDSYKNIVGYVGQNEAYWRIYNVGDNMDWHQFLSGDFTANSAEILFSITYQTA